MNKRLFMFAMKDKMKDFQIHILSNKSPVRDRKVSESLRRSLKILLYPILSLTGFFYFKNNGLRGETGINANQRVNGVKKNIPFYTRVDKVKLLAGSSPASTPIKNQHAAQGSLPLILRHYKWDSANTNTVPIKVVRTGYQAFENSIMRTLFSTVKDVDYITSE